MSCSMANPLFTHHFGSLDALVILFCDLMLQINLIPSLCSVFFLVIIKSIRVIDVFILLLVKFILVDMFFLMNQYISRYVLFNESTFSFADVYREFHSPSTTPLLSAWQSSCLSSSMPT